jgi:transposase
MPFGPFFTPRFLGSIATPGGVVMRFVGLDLHKHTMEVCILGAKGEVLARHSVACERKALKAFAQDYLETTDRLAVEATTNTWTVAGILRPFVASITVGNPLQIKAIAQAKVKTDKIDAEVLANLLRCDFLPDVWEPDAPTQKLRHLTGVRSALVADRTRLKNRIHSILAGLLIVLPESGLFTTKGLVWARTVELPEDARGTVDCFLRLYDATEAELERLDLQLRTLAHHDPRVRLLMTLPGVAHGVALTLIAALGDITRFRDGDHAASYLGLTPIVRQSAGKCYRGSITKAGSSTTRAMLTQAAQHAAEHPGPLGAFFRRLKKRKTHNIAIVATAPASW